MVLIDTVRWGFIMPWEIKMTTVCQGRVLRGTDAGYSPASANAIEAIGIYERKQHGPNPTVLGINELHNDYDVWSSETLHRVHVSNSEISEHVVNKKITTLPERPLQAENARGRHGEKKYYGGSKPLCPKCNYHHDGPCAPKCHRCNIVGHLVRNYRSPTNERTTNNLRGSGGQVRRLIAMNVGIKGTTGGIAQSERTQGHKNQIGGTEAHGVVHILRGEETDQDPNNIKDEIKA
ncbi:hypothetical protein Tco_0158754 [Tanacetum coccineum]